MTAHFSGLVQLVRNICVTEYHDIYVPHVVNTYRRVCNQINRTSSTSGEGTAYPSGSPEFTAGIWCGLYYSIFSFMCRLFVPFLLTIVLSVLLRFADSGCPSGVFKLFLFNIIFFWLTNNLRCKKMFIVFHIIITITITRTPVEALLC